MLKFREHSLDSRYYLDIVLLSGDGVTLQLNCVNSERDFRMTSI